jgi:IS30 family transposase
MKPKGIRHIEFDERLRIQGHIQNGLTRRQIAQLENRSVYTIIDEIRRNGGMKTYSAMRAQERCDSMKVRVSKNSGTYSYPMRLKDLEHKVDSMSMQLEILFDMVEELKKCRELK